MRDDLYSCIRGLEDQESPRPAGGRSAPAPPWEATEKGAAPPFTEGFETLEEGADRTPGQPKEVKEGIPEINSRRELREFDEE